MHSARRQRRLEKKERQLQKSLQRWAKRYLALSDKEVLKVRLTITQTVVDVTKLFGPQALREHVELDFSINEVRRVRSLIKSGSRLDRILLLVRNNPEAPFSGRDTRPITDISDIAAMNRRLAKLGSDLRFIAILETSGGDSWDNQYRLGTLMKSS